VKAPSGGAITSSDAAWAVTRLETSPILWMSSKPGWSGRLGRAYVNVISATGGGAGREGHRHRRPQEPGRIRSGLVTTIWAAWPTHFGLLPGLCQAEHPVFEPVPGRDVDGDGHLDDIRLLTTLANVAETLRTGR